MRKDSFIPNAFPSFKPVRVQAGKLIELANAKLAVVTNPVEKEFIQTLNTRLASCDPLKNIYLTIEQGKILGIF